MEKQKTLVFVSKKVTKKVVEDFGENIQNTIKKYIQDENIKDIQNIIVVLDSYAIQNVFDSTSTNNATKQIVECVDDIFKDNGFENYCKENKISLNIVLSSTLTKLHELNFLQNVSNNEKGKGKEEKGYIPFETTYLFLEPDYIILQDVYDKAQENKEEQDDLVYLKNTIQEFAKEQKEKIGPFFKDFEIYTDYIFEEKREENSKEKRDEKSKETNLDNEQYKLLENNVVKVIQICSMNICEKAKHKIRIYLKKNNIQNIFNDLI